MKLKVLSAMLMSASMSAFVIACDEYGQNRRVETAEERAEAREEVREEAAEAREEAAEARKDIKEDVADVKMDLTKRMSELEKEWNELEAKFEQRADLSGEYQTLSRDIEGKLQEMKAQIEQIDKGGVTTPDSTKETLKRNLDDLEKRIDAAEDRLG